LSEAIRYVVYVSETDETKEKKRKEKKRGVISDEDVGITHLEMKKKKGKWSDSRCWDPCLRS
jgi:hypothetical protein